MSQNFEYFGKYILLEKLATGGMAEVYLAKTYGVDNVSRLFAVKRILPEYSNNSDFITMFKEEAKIAINLNHSNVVSIIEFGEEKGQLFISMEYVEGNNLRQILNKLNQNRLRISVENAVFICKEVARGLDHAHRCVDSSTGQPLNISHRDISPQNVMVNYEGEVKICDFGIAKAESRMESTQAGTLKGKFGYMSPEQAEGLDIDYRTDIFSLGIVLWELLAQERLFVSNNEINTLKKIRECQIPSLSKIDPAIPAELERIVMKALAKDRNLRFQSAADLHRDLNRLLNRHAPDFSPDDFSLFIKQLYMVEREEARMRMIDYARFQPAPPDQGRTEVVTSMTQTVTESDVAMAPEDIDLSFETNGATLATKTQTKTHPSNFNEERRQASTFNPHPGPKVTVPQNRNSPFYDDDLFEASRSISRRNTAPLPIGKMLIWATIIGASAWMYFGGEGEKQFHSLRETLFSSSSSPSEISDTANLSSKEAPAPKVRLMVTSVPAGAEIFLDGTPTKVITPGQIEVPKNQPFSVEIRKDGYINYAKPLLMTQSDTLEVTLKKGRFGYLDIEVYGSTAEIYINGEKIAKKPPIRRLAVAAGARIRIEAKDPVSGSTAEQVVEVDVDSVLPVKLFLNSDSFTRNPANRYRRRN
ncbi:MAG: hypothetical protein COT74_07025 [Bdellovibrionales bacterium CG10_big_fil_rev_8_21_14_0_10_45_34]|nr:MAG: hypothetical protein COT74_07025 [Bdellovibrionales bacterium CG10_big_fil_rev_8_21_14_0_10_45_34]